MDARRLVRSVDPSPNEYFSVMADFYGPEFSITGRALYFMTGCGMVNGCLYKVDARTRRVQKLGQSNGKEVLRRGRHAGYLLVQQHEYYPSPEGGSYEEIWLVSPGGWRVRDIGPGEFAPGYDGAIVEFEEADALPAKRR